MGFYWLMERLHNFPAITFDWNNVSYDNSLDSFRLSFGEKFALNIIFCVIIVIGIPFFVYKFYKVDEIMKIRELLKFIKDEMVDKDAEIGVLNHGLKHRKIGLGYDLVDKEFDIYLE